MPTDFSPTRRIELEYQRIIRKLMLNNIPTRRPEQSFEQWVADLGAVSERRDIADAAAYIAGEMGRWVNVLNARTWREAAARSQRSSLLHRLLQRELAGPVGDTLRRIVKENASYITRTPRTVAEQLTSEIARAQQAGARPETIAKMMHQRFPQMMRSRIHLISRTETMKASAALTEARAEHLDILAYEWLTSEDQRVRPSHRNLNGVIVLYSDPPSPEALIGEKSTLGRYHAGNAPNCFPAHSEANLSNGCNKLWRRFYSGPMTVLSLSEGALMEATPNHPILTRRGWLPINALQNGDYVVKAKRQTAGTIENQNHRFVRFGDLFEALQREIETETTPGSEFDFHSDGSENDIHAIDVNRFLLSRRPAVSTQGFAQFLFSWAEMELEQFAAMSSSQFCVGRIAGAAASLLSRGSQLRALGRSESRHSNRHGVTAISDVGVAFDEDLADHFAGAVMFGRQRFLAGTSLVATNDELVIEIAGGRTVHIPLEPETVAAESLADGLRFAWDQLSSGGNRHSVFDSMTQVTGKFTRHFEGHVFNLETNSGWYGVGPSNIVVHNCRCPQSPLLTLDDVKWPHRVHVQGKIMMMTRAAFSQRFGFSERRAA